MNIGDRLTVDDALISTDVDRLIQIMSKRKRADIYALEKETGLSRKSIEKWLHVLEDQGYISIDYRLTNMVVQWTGPEEEHTLNNNHDHFDHEQPEQMELPVPETVKAPEPERTPAEPPAEPDEPERAEHTEEPRPETPEEETPEIKSNILNTLTEEKEESVEEPIENETTQKQTEEAPPWIRRRTEELPERTLTWAPEVRNVLGGYMEEIAQQKQEIARLKQEKEKVYREGYVPLETRMESDLATLTEKIMEKEARILELKERLLDLPDRVEEVEKLARKARQVREEGKKTLENTRTRVQRFLGELENEESALLQRMDESRQRIHVGKEKTDQLRQANQQLDEQLGTLRQQMDQVQSAVAQLDERLRDMLVEVQDATEMRGEITEVSHRAMATVEKKEAELQELEETLQEIRKVGQWAREYVNDYEQKIDEISRYAENSEDELAKLREAAETEYTRRYLRELQELTHEYEGQLHDVVETEQTIDKKLEEARTRLKKLLLESHQTVQRLTKPLSRAETFAIVAEKARRQAKEKKRKIEEKEMERDKLVEDIQRVRTKRKLARKSRDRRIDANNKRNDASFASRKKGKKK